MDDIWYFVMIGLVVLVSLFLVFVLVDVVTGYSTYENGIVVEKIFSPGKTGVGAGPVIGGSANGGTGIAVVVTSTSDEWLVLVKTNSGTCKAEASRDKWAEINKGDTVRVKHSVGRFSKNIWSSKVMI